MSVLTQYINGLEDELQWSHIEEVDNEEVKRLLLQLAKAVHASLKDEISGQL